MLNNSFSQDGRDYQLIKRVTKNNVIFGINEVYKLLRSKTRLIENKSLFLLLAVFKPAVI